MVARRRERQRWVAGRLGVLNRERVPCAPAGVELMLSPDCAMAVS